MLADRPGFATAQAVVADCTPPEKRKHGMAMIGAAFGIGFTFGPLVGGLVARHRGTPLLPPLRGLAWRKLVLAAFVGQFLSMVFWLGGYKFTSASVAAILNESSSVFILLLAWAWLKEPLTRRAIAGVVCTLAGVGCMLIPA